MTWETRPIMKRNYSPVYTRFLALLPLLSLGGCSTDNFWLFNPKGPIAAAELHYMVLDVVLMSIVIVPTVIFTLWVIMKFRAKNKARHDPHWSHSNALEVLVWGVPILIVGVLAYFSYVGTHEVNPWNPTAITKHPQYANAKPLEIDVITTDWQWMFIYPKQKIAVANELVIPVHTPVHFRLTSTSVTNNFYIPQLVGQVYVMPGMRSKQSLVASHPGEYHGFSAALSGGGFSWMDFKTRAVSQSEFDAWVAKIRQQGGKLGYAEFAAFAKPTVNIGGKVQYFSDVQPGLFAQVIQNVRDGKLRYATPIYLTDNMDSEEFKQHSN